ncbi:MAG: TraB/GumN family protein, partial [Spirosomaceae bacterium]|nr:TraB/GumN family protein [Spirosomataceae bacterium]
MKNLFKTFALLFTISAAFAQQEKGLLYEISGNELTKPSYVFGTFHIMCAADYEMSEMTKEKFGKTEQVVMELDMDDPQMMMQMQQQMFMKDGKSLKDLLPKEKYDEVSKYFVDSLKMPFQMMQKVKPFALTSMLYPKILNCPIQSFEMDFVKLADAEKKEILGLETVTDQMGVFDVIPYQKQAEGLVEAIEDMDKSRAEFDKLVAVYKTQDINTLAKMVAEEENGYAEYTDVLLNNRNENWIEKMENFAKAKPTFF